MARYYIRRDSMTKGFPMLYVSLKPGAPNDGYSHEIKPCEHFRDVEYNDLLALAPVASASAPEPPPEGFIDLYP